jgi:hypothetical protein
MQCAFFREPEMVVSSPREHGPPGYDLTRYEKVSADGATRPSFSDTVQFRTTDFKTSLSLVATTSVKGLLMTGKLVADVYSRVMEMLNDLRGPAIIRLAF